MTRRSMNFTQAQIAASCAMISSQVGPLPVGVDGAHTAMPAIVRERWWANMRF
jgi:hypothetical protein